MYNATIVLNDARYSTADVKLEHQHTVRQSSRRDYTVSKTELTNESRKEMIERDSAWTRARGCDPRPVHHFVRKEEGDGKDVQKKRTERVRLPEASFATVLRKH